MFDHRKAAIDILMNAMALFPASASVYSTQEAREAAVAVLSNAMAQRKHEQKHVARAIYWLSETDSDFMPSIPKIIRFMSDRIPSEIDQEYIEQKRQLERPQLTEEQRAVNKQRIANLLKELKGE